MYKNEKDMYPHVCSWLKRVLSKKYKTDNVIVEDTSQKELSRWLYDKNLHKYFKDHESFEIEVDVTGIAITQKDVYMAFVECKLDKIKLRDISQLLGYSKVAMPSLSLLLSPAGLSDSMNSLFNIFRRYDVLQYATGKYILIGKWDCIRSEPEIRSLIPRGVHHLIFIKE